MLGVYVTVPVACFRKGLAREYLETEPIPPPGLAAVALFLGARIRHRLGRAIARIKIDVRA